MLCRHVPRLVWLLILASGQAISATVPPDTTGVLELGVGWEYAPSEESFEPRAASCELPMESSKLEARSLKLSWQRVALPHRQDTEPGGLYRLSFAIPAAWSRHKIALVVRPTLGSVRVWLNGQPIGVRPPSALDVRLDVSDTARAGGMNTLLIAVWAPGAVDHGGLAACWLEATGAVAVDRLATSEWCLAQGAVVDARLEVGNHTLERFEGYVELTLEPCVQAPGRNDIWGRRTDIGLDPSRSAAIAHTFEIEQPRLWRFDDPFLYRLTAAVRTREGETVHSLVRRIGLRSFELAEGRWHINDEWMRLAGTALRVPGATLVCTQPGQASEACRALSEERRAPESTGAARSTLHAPRSVLLPELLDLCDEQGIVAWLDAPARRDDVPGWRETIGDLAAAAAWHPCVWGWVVSNEPEAYRATLAHLRELTPRLPIGRPMPELASDAAGFDFVVGRFTTRADRQDNDAYGQRLEGLVRDGGGKPIVVIDRVSPSEPGDRDGVLRAVSHRRNEAARRLPIGMLFFELDRDEPLTRLAEKQSGAFSVRPPRHEARLEGKEFVIKSTFEGAIASPVAWRLPCYSLAGYSLAWRAERGGARLAGGSIPLPTIRPHTVEGWPTAPVRGEAEWRLPEAGSIELVVELRDAAGRVADSHRSAVVLSASPDGKAVLKVGPPAETPPAETPPAPPFVAPEAILTLDLAKLFNNDGISPDAKKTDGNFDLPNLPSGSSYPAEQLPASNALLSPPSRRAVQFRFPDKADGRPNNIRCAEQRLDVPPGAYATLWLLAAADTNDQEGTLHLAYERGEEPVALRVTDWCREPQPGDIEAVRCSARHTWDGKREDKVCRIWAVAVPLRREPLRAVVLPKNESIHVFAATLIRASETIAIPFAALAGYFNNDGISWRANPADGNFDLPGRPVGDSFIADLLPKGDALVPMPGEEAITFRFPSKDDRRANNVACDGQRILFPEPHESFDAAWFLGAGHAGARTAPLIIEYEDGRAEAELRLADWTSRPGNGETDVIRVPARHTFDGKEEPRECGLAAWRVPLDGHRKLMAIGLPRERTMHVFAMTLTRSAMK